MNIIKINSRYEIRIVIVEIRDNNLTGDVYDSLEQFKKDHPNSGYKYGFIVFDTKTGFIPDNCNDWNDSPEEALMDYKENCTAVYKLENEKFSSESMERIKYALVESKGRENFDVLAVLEYDDYDIELTFRDYQNGKAEFDYFCCRKVDGQWESWDVVDFGSKLPYEFDTLEELKADMKAQLEKFLSEKLS